MSTVMPSLTVHDGAAAIAFYQQAFGAVEMGRMPSPDGKIMHAELKIGDSLLFLNDEFPDMGCPSPMKLNGSPVTIHLQVEDVDTVFEQALQAGATVTMPLQDMFWGDRYGKLVDPFGHHWSLATHIEDVSSEEMQQRAAALFGG
ncbi:MAG: VOC family protein [Leptolyngbyaceae cyanobacterium bins.349]|nr:VOC family protein [Leptolyngbyaceae cyanobacterium bins.349]